MLLAAQLLAKLKMHTLFKVPKPAFCFFCQPLYILSAASLFLCHSMEHGTSKIRAVCLQNKAILLNVIVCKSLQVVQTKIYSIHSL